MDVLQWAVCKGNKVHKRNKVNQKSRQTDNADICYCENWWQELKAILIRSNPRWTTHVHASSLSWLCLKRWLRTCPSEIKNVSQLRNIKPLLQLLAQASHRIICSDQVYSMVPNGTFSINVTDTLEGPKRVLKLIRQSSWTQLCYIMHHFVLLGWALLRWDIILTATTGAESWVITDLFCNTLSLNTHTQPKRYISWDLLKEQWFPCILTLTENPALLDLRLYLMSTGQLSSAWFFTTFVRTNRSKGSQNMYPHTDTWFTPFPTSSHLSSGSFVNMSCQWLWDSQNVTEASRSGITVHPMSIYWHVQFVFHLYNAVGHYW